MNKRYCSFILAGLFLQLSGFAAQGAVRTLYSAHAQVDSLPKVFRAGAKDVVGERLDLLAANAFQRFSLPREKEDLLRVRDSLKNKILRKTRARVFHDMPLNMEEMNSLDMDGYEIKNIIYQTRPDVYATANLYVPEGRGPFPGILVMMGHSSNGKLYDLYQSVGHVLARSGYVALLVDPWGAGERTTRHGVFEYHGANLGASLMDVGETLMGMQITDNIRGVDLLCSLDYVDRNKIGATGASGGGNQTMWVTAMDERIKAAVPVVSVGTFESYVMNSNCICELLPDGLTFTEEAGVLALIAPRALKICNAMLDSNPAFFPAEMLRSFEQARQVYDAFGANDRLAYQLYPTPHGYRPEIRHDMVAWFDLQLKNKGNGIPANPLTVQPLPPEKLMVFKAGERDPQVLGTAEYCRRKSDELSRELLGGGTVDADRKRKDLASILRTGPAPGIREVTSPGMENGWEKLIIRTAGDQQIPVLIRPPRQKGGSFVFLLHGKGKDSIPSGRLQELARSGTGIILTDLFGTGERSSPTAGRIDGSLPPFHTLSRSLLWLGKTVMGEWVNEIGLVTRAVKARYEPGEITIEGYREAGVAGMFAAALNGGYAKVEVVEAPVSYRFDDREGIDFYNMSIHVPGIINWGDLPLLQALIDAPVTFYHPLTISGRELGAKEMKSCRQYYADMEKMTGKRAGVEFEPESRP